MDPFRVTIDPRLRWGTPCLRETGISVGHVVALHQAGHPVDRILESCPELTADDVDAALEWYLEHGAAALGPRPPRPGRGHPRIAVDPGVHGGYPTVRGTRVTVDAVLGLWERGFTVAEILDEHPELREEDVAAAVAYDTEAQR